MLRTKVLTLLSSPAEFPGHFLPPSSHHTTPEAESTFQGLASPTPGRGGTGLECSSRSCGSQGPLRVPPRWDYGQHAFPQDILTLFITTTSLIYIKKFTDNEFLGLHTSDLSERQQCEFSYGHLLFLLLYTFSSGFLHSSGMAGLPTVVHTKTHCHFLPLYWSVFPCVFPDRLFKKKLD